MEFVSSQAAEIANLTLLKAVGGPLNGAKLMLFTDPSSVDPTTPRADLIDATYTGYAQGAITWLAPSIADDGSVEMVGTSPQFRPTDAVTPESISGAAVVTSADALVMAATFDAPIPMDSATDSLIVTVRVRNTSSGLGVVVS